MSGLRHMRDLVLLNYLQTKAPLVILELDEQGVVRGANQYACRLLGTECLGRALQLLVIDFDTPFTMARLRTLPAGSLLTVKEANGMPSSLRVQFLPLGNDGILVAEADLQDKDELNTTLLRLNSELSGISRELQKKTAQLQQANNLKNQFLGMAAHDLRNPLAGIYAYLDLIADDLAPTAEDTLCQALQEMKREVGYMLNLVSNLLDYSVIEQGHLHLTMQEVTLRELLQQVVQLQNLMTRKRQVEICLQMEYDPGVMLVDLNRIRQVLNNLLSNAAKYSPDSGVIYLITARQGDALLIQIQDQGPGVPEHEQDKLFKPFGTTSTRAVDGDKSTGLGLSICKRIIDAHGGSIWEENLPHGGACFCFTLLLGQPEPKRNDL